MNLRVSPREFALAAIRGKAEASTVHDVARIVPARSLVFEPSTRPRRAETDVVESIAEDVRDAQTRWRVRAHSSRGDPAPLSQTQTSPSKPARRAGFVRFEASSRNDTHCQTATRLRATRCHEVLRDVFRDVLRGSEAIVDGESDLAYAILVRLEDDLRSELAVWERPA